MIPVTVSVATNLIYNIASSMHFLTFVLSFIAVIAVALGNGIQFSRTVNGIAADTDFVLKFDTGCSASDAHGSNKCSFAWGQQISGSVEGHLGHNLEVNSFYHGTFIS